MDSSQHPSLHRAFRSFLTDRTNVWANSVDMLKNGTLIFSTIMTSKSKKFVHVFRTKFPTKRIFQIFFRFRKLMELRCFATYLSNDPRIHSHRLYMLTRNKMTLEIVHEINLQSCGMKGRTVHRKTMWQQKQCTRCSSWVIILSPEVVCTLKLESLKTCFQKRTFFQPQCRQSFTHANAYNGQYKLGHIIASSCHHVVWTKLCIDI